MAETCNPGECEGDPTYDKPIPVNPYPDNSGSKDYKVVDELPDEGESGVIYWLRKTGSEDAYDLYEWVNDDWRKLDVDISLYSGTGNNVNGAMTQKATTEALGQKADLNDIPVYTSGKRITVKNDKSINFDGVVILSYGHSTWQDFINAYNDNVIVYCRASSNEDPSLNSQSRLAFMAYVDNPANPTNVEFQYVRSVNTKSSSQPCDQVYVYKLTSAGTWTVIVRNMASKIVAGDGLSSSYSNGTITLNATGGSGGVTQFFVNSDAPSNGAQIYKDAAYSLAATESDITSAFLSGGAIISFIGGDWPDGYWHAMHYPISWVNDWREDSVCTPHFLDENRTDWYVTNDGKIGQA